MAGGMVLGHSAAMEPTLNYGKTLGQKSWRKIMAFGIFCVSLLSSYYFIFLHINALESLSSP